MKDTLIVVVSHNKARFLVAHARKILHERPSLQNDAVGSYDPHTKHEGFSKPMSAPGSYYTPHTDQKTVEKEHFVKALCCAIDHTMQEIKAKGVIIIAEPKLLGIIRQDLGHHDHRHINVERTLNLDLIHASADDIESRLFDLK